MTINIRTFKIVPAFQQYSSQKMKFAELQVLIFRELLLENNYIPVSFG